MTDKPRTWTIDFEPDEPFAGAWIVNYSFEDKGQVRVIELEPVLDLLERAGDWLDAEDDIPTVLKGDIDALLREHGRLR